MSFFYFCIDRFFMFFALGLLFDFFGGVFELLVLLFVFSLFVLVRLPW